MQHFGGMISFTLHSDDKKDAFKVLEKFKIFALAESLGGVESLCGHPATMTHAGISKQDRAKIGLKDSLIRLSIGLEDVEDLINDIHQALDILSLRPDKLPHIKLLALLGLLELPDGADVLLNLRDDHIPGPLGVMFHGERLL